MMEFTTFDTAIGRCAIAWAGDHVTRILLPVGAGAAVEDRLRQLVPEAIRAETPPWIDAVVARLVAHLDGHLDDLRDVPVAPARGTFDRRIYALTREIPPGATRSYGELAGAAGDSALAREVGQAMGRNPTPLIVPCHRVLPADGSIGGFSAPGGSETKRRLLVIERSPAVAQAGLFE